MTAFQCRVATALLLLMVFGVTGFSSPSHPPCSITNLSCPFRVLSSQQCSLTEHKHRNLQLVMMTQQQSPQEQPRGGGLWKRTKRTVVSLALALNFLRSPAAYASSRDLVDTSARANDLLIESLRPGATKEDAELALDSEVCVREKSEVNTVLKQKEETTSKKNRKNTKKPAKPLYYDDDGDLDDDELFDETEMAELESNSKTKSAMKAQSNVYLKTSKITAASYVKAVFIFITLPVLLFGGIETYKRRSESAYVKKALKIQQMKKEEYLNQTAVEEAALKANETAVDDGNDDDDDEDDDDDDDFDEPPPPSPKKPKGGNDGDGGNDGPSSDDIDRLNRLMKK
jgi:hypothetical protein